MVRELIDLTGKKFNKLTVIELIGSKYGVTKWKCKCDCGNYAVVASVELKNGTTKACGCLKGKHRKYPISSENNRLYKTWSHMKSRCYREKDISYKNYGGRGIAVCNEWLQDFMSFYNWSIENGYKKNLEIDRINSDENYSSSNCRWVTKLINTRNRRISINIDGKSLMEIAIESSIKYKTLWQYMKKNNCACGIAVEHFKTQVYINKRKVFKEKYQDVVFRET